MGELTNALLLLRVIGEMAGLVERAVSSGRDVTEEEIDAAFNRADAADAKWAKANKEKSDG